MCNSIEFEISNMKMLCAFIIIDLLIHEMLSRKKSFPIPMSALLVFLVQFIFAASPAITSSKMLTIMHPTKFYFPVYYLAIFVPSQVNTSGCPFLTNVRLTLSEFHPYFFVSGHVIKFQDQTTDVAYSLYFDPFCRLLMILLPY